MKKSQLVIMIIALTWGWNGCASKIDDHQVVKEEVSNEKTFTNPIPDGADPWVFKKDGTYYYCGSGGGGIYVSQSDKMTDPGERRTVWKAPEEGWNRTNIWAPELHFIEGK